MDLLILTLIIILILMNKRYQVSVWNIHIL